VARGRIAAAGLSFAAADIIIRVSQTTGGKAMKHTTCLLSLAVALLFVGCGVGRHVQKGINSYNVGDLARAMEIWYSLQDAEAEMNPKGLVRYLVYRGLTHHRLGQRKEAAYFLSRGKRVYATGDPRWLPPQAVAEMEQALGALGGGSPAPGAPPAGGSEPLPAAGAGAVPGPEPVDIQ
jgi:hypothetical protein